jgi:hypothetical protein
MAQPLIFTITAAWDDEAAVWTGHCDDIPVPIGIRSRHTANAILRQAGLPKAF